MPKENLEEYFYNYMIKKLIIMTAKKKPQIKILCYMKHFQWFVYQKASSKKLENEPQAGQTVKPHEKPWFRVWSKKRKKPLELLEIRRHRNGADGDTRSKWIFQEGKQEGLADRSCLGCPPRVVGGSRDIPSRCV